MGRQDLNQIRSKCYGISQKKKFLSMGYHIFGTKIEILRLREMQEVVKDHTFSAVLLLLPLADAGLCIWALSLPPFEEEKRQYVSVCLYWFDSV